MRKMIHFHLHFYVAAVLPIMLPVSATAQPNALERTVTSERWGFSMITPPGWHGGINENTNTPMFVNFGPRTAPRGGDRLPRNGATIAVVAGDGIPGAEPSQKWLRSPRDWADDESRNGAMIRHPNIVAVTFPPEAGVSDAVMTEYDNPTYSPDEQSHHTVLVVWRFNGKLFGAHLTYLKGNPEGSRLEKVFLDILRSLRPLPH